MSGSYDDIPAMLKSAVDMHKSLLLIESPPGQFKIIPQRYRFHDEVRAFITPFGTIVESVLAKKEKQFSLPDVAGLDIVRV